MSLRIRIASWLTIVSVASVLQGQTSNRFNSTGFKPSGIEQTRLLGPVTAPMGPVTEGLELQPSPTLRYSTRRSTLPAQRVSEREASWAKRRKAIIELRQRQGVSLLRPHVIDQRRFGTPRRFFYGPIWKTATTSPYRYE